MLIEKIISWFVCTLLTVAGWFLFSGCAMPPPAPVYTPAPCAAEAPKRPSKGESTAESALNLVEYAKKLEFALESCK